MTLVQNFSVFHWPMSEYGRNTKMSTALGEAQQSSPGKKNRHGVVKIGWKLVSIKRDVIPEEQFGRI